MISKLLWAGMLDFSTVDYPGKLCAVIFLGGCPFRCPWCHSPELATADTQTCKEKSVSEIVKQLKQNFVIDAVSITGGEPLLQPSTINLLETIKNQTTLLTKIDTTCFFPEQLEKALPFLDAISIDIKAPLNEKYSKATDRNDWELVINNLKRAHNILKNWKRSNPSFMLEVRTTIVPEINNKTEDIEQISHQIAYLNADIYTLQQFRPTKTLDKAYEAKEQISREKIVEWAKIAKTILPNTKVRLITKEKGFEYI